MSRNFVLLTSIALMPLSSLAASVQLAWSAPQVFQMEKLDPVIEPGLLESALTVDESRSLPIIVFFTDKGVFSQIQYESALQSARINLSETALERRTKSRGKGNLLDFRDLAVNGEYINRVLVTGAQKRHVLRWFNAISLDATPSQIKQISALRFVRYIKAVAFAKTNLDITFEPLAPDASLVSLDYGPSQRQLEQINAIAAHELGFKGQGVVVCMMDTGYRQGHDAFQSIISSGRLLAQYDFINGDSNTDYDPAQDVGGQPDHGTLTWSTLGGEASSHLYGPSHLSQFVLAKTEDISSERHIEEDNWAAGAEWADSIGASVISASLGYRWFDSGEGDYSYSQLDGNSTIVTIAADMAAYNGIAVATAMGNEGNFAGSLIAPADGDSVIACGAVDSLGNLAGFSSWGPTSDDRIKPEVCAQGVRTVCVDPYDIHGYRIASGTSLSTPLVGGACGVLLSAHPNWTPMMVREALMMTADRFDSPDNAYGSGIVDAARALYYRPAGDIIFEHAPSPFAAPNTPLAVDISVTGGAGIDTVYLSYRAGEIGDYTTLNMSTADGINFSAQIPGEPGGTIYYYFKAVDIDGSVSFNPLGGDAHPFAVSPGSSEFSDSFENGILYWKSSGIFDFWGLSALYANNGNLCIADSPTTPYRNNTDSYLESNFALDLDRASSATLQFWIRGSLQASADSLFIEASSDGVAWQRLGQAITGSIPSFAQHSRDLSPFAGQPDVGIRFRLDTDNTGIDEGLYIDDISVTIVFAPRIGFSPPSIADTLEQGDIETHNLIISNIGMANLILNLQAVEGGRALFENQDAGEVNPEHPLNDWLFVFPSSDTLSSGDTVAAEVTLNSSTLSPGEYGGFIEIASNDPDAPTSIVPVSLLVTQFSTCQYIPGDVNHNGATNGVDVTFSVSYLKGIGQEPPYSCDCPPHGILKVEGDANGDCSYNGIDVSFMVNYLKGGSLFPQGCADCPPGALGLFQGR
jgi:hypothetical protein